MDDLNFFLDVLLLFSRGVAQWPSADATAALTAGRTALANRLQRGDVLDALAWVGHRLVACADALMGDDKYAAAVAHCARLHHDLALARAALADLDASVAELTALRDDQASYVPARYTAAFARLMARCNRVDRLCAFNVAAASLWGVFAESKAAVVDLLRPWRMAVRLFVFAADATDVVVRLPVWDDAAVTTQAVAEAMGAAAATVRRLPGPGYDVYVSDDGEGTAWTTASGVEYSCRAAVCFHHAVEGGWPELRVYDCGVRPDEVADRVRGLPIYHDMSAWTTFKATHDPRVSDVQDVFQSYLAQLQDVRPTDL